MRSSLKGSGEAQKDPAVMRTGLEVPRLDTGEIREEDRWAGAPEDPGSTGSPFF